MAVQNTNKTTSESEPKQDIIVGLDIGTSKVCALVAAKDNTPNTIKILGLGIADSEGLNRGVVVNIDKTVKSIEKVIEQAEQQSGHKITEVIVGIAGDHIQSMSTRGIVAVSGANHEISLSDVNRVIDECRNIKIPSELRVLHVIPQDFIIDGQDGILDPVGMSGVRMEANAHIVTALDTAVQNIYRCIERLGIKVKNIILEPLASSYAVLDEEEKEVGVALVDIGGGTTDIAIFEENCIRFTSVFGIAGKQVTDDIRKGLGIILNQAERIKKENGHALRSSIIQDEIFMIPGIGGRKPLEVSKSMLSQIIQPRMEEIFEFALGEIRRSGYSGKLGAGIVLTGGCSLLKGVDELAQEIFGMQVKIGFPSSVSYSGLAPEVKNPLYSTAVGLVMFGMKDMEIDEELNNVAASKTVEKNPTDTVKEKEKSGSIFGKIKDMLSQL